MATPLNRLSKSSCTEVGTEAVSGTTKRGVPKGTPPQTIQQSNRDEAESELVLTALGGIGPITGITGGIRVDLVPGLR